MPVQNLGNVRGPMGTTAYQYAVAGGYSGTEEEFKIFLNRNVPTDKTLTLPDTAADAQETGNKIRKIENEQIKVENTAPTTSTEGKIGQFYINTSTERVYKCVSVADGFYEWKDINSIKDDLTEKDYRIGAEKGLIYIEEAN